MPGSGSHRGRGASTIPPSASPLRATRASFQHPVMSARKMNIFPLQERSLSVMSKMKRGESSTQLLQGIKSQFSSAFSRKKEFVYEEDIGLKRVLRLHDLVFLGLGSMLGMGVYIMAGDLANKVGPAMILSFVFAGFACTLSALCYAEFAGRTPCTGSAYAYCYITVGEFVAFILGWNLCLEFVIGTACLVRGMSSYMDSIFNGVIAKYELENMAMHVKFLSPYPDFLSFVIMIIFSGVVSVGVRESTAINNTFVVVNMVTIIALIVVGILKASGQNWTIPAGSHERAGNGGFMPYGFSSVMEGAATCFYAYTGFDTIATTGGEAKNPQRIIPLALIISITLAVMVYSSVSATFTLMWPYFDENLRNGSPYPYILDQLGLTNVKYVVTIGAMAAVTGCTLSSTFGMARIVYAIADDGLLFKSLSKINRHTKTPVNATIITGILTGALSIIFSTDQLIDMTSLGTLMAYTMVAICVLLLRYEDKEMETINSLKMKKEYNGSLTKLFNIPYKYDRPNEITSWSAKCGTYAIILVSAGLGSIFAFGADRLMSSEPILITCTAVLALAMITALIVIARQPKSKAELPFKVRPVPLLPAISIFINIYLMLKLNAMTWIRFLIWLFIGLVVYFSYGIWHSKEGKKYRDINGAIAEKEKEEPNNR